MLVEAGVQGTPVVALVDTGADTLYMSTQLADEIKLPYEKVQGSVKGMTAESMPISGVAKNVSLQIGQWQGKVDITIAPLNKKKLYLGIDFLREPVQDCQGQQPITPNKVAIGYKGVSPAAYKFARSWEEQQEAARACLSKAAKRMKKWADKKRRP
ncbi:hypothetical protein GH714_018605 [Hevea brasiliensis]|uniref:Peptidase A2 domain-containing protein n=1 Tax=Hevea brasiliensis TaxID=3981 RepID=A0A6A6N0Z4_HEVBR|nr:hypothetical protein GH714_018605 [Hevea brasiliensis]